MINRVTILGRLGYDVKEIKFMPNGTAVIEFSLATNERRGDATETHWHVCKAFGKTAENLQPLLKKGVEVYVEGKIWSRSYQGRDGTQKKAVEVIVNVGRVCMPRNKSIPHEESNEGTFYGSEDGGPSL